MASEALDPELAALAAQAKRRRRLILAIVVGNALVFAVLVGWPYFRGRHRAMAGREAFGELAACLWGGELAEDPGLSLPPGEELAYVDAFRAAPESWPMHCADELEAVPPEEIWWLFPDTRHAEGEVRRAAAMVRGELEAAEGADQGGAVPSRPRLAVQRLQAALTLWSEEADVYVGLEDPLIALPERAAAIRPERVPLRAAEDAELWMEPRGDGLEIRAMDERGISWVRVGGGRVDMRRLRKPSLVESFGASERWPLLVWRTPDERCAPDCSRQAGGVAFLTDETDVTPDPTWLAAHPAGPGATHVRADGEGNVWVVAAAEDGARALRSFPGALGEAEEAQESGEQEAEAADESGPRPLAPATVVPLEGEGTPVLLPGGAVRFVDGAPLLRGDWLAVRAEGRTRVFRVRVAGSDPPGSEAGARPMGSDSEVGSRDSESESEVGSRDSDSEVGSRDSEVGSRDSEAGSRDSESDSEVGSRDSEVGSRESEVGSRDSDSDSEAGSRQSELGSRQLGSDLGSWGASTLGSRDPASDAARPTTPGLEPWGTLAEAPAGLRLAGAGEVAALLAPREGEVAVFRCRERRCEELGAIDGAEDVRVAVVNEAVVVAYDREGDRQIRIARWDAQGAFTDEPAPAACTSDEGGFCGPPIIGARGGRLALGARDGSDLWVIETTDGAEWRPLRGLR